MGIWLVRKYSGFKETLFASFSGFTLKNINRFCFGFLCDKYVKKCIFQYLTCIIFKFIQSHLLFKVLLTT